MTPVAALDPYLTAEDASLNTLVLTASFGFTSSMLLLGTELTIIKGTLIERLVLLFVPTTGTFTEPMQPNISTDFNKMGESVVESILEDKVLVKETRPK